MAQAKQKTQPPDRPGNDAQKNLEQRVEKLESVLREFFKHSHYDTIFKL